jgi:hypothetical protein
MPPRLLVISLVITAALVGCAPLADGAPRLPEARCRAAGAEAELGKTVDDETAENARMGAGAMRARIIRPGQAVTMDADPQRLNIEVDETGRIRRLRCG